MPASRLTFLDALPPAERDELLQIGHRRIWQTGEILIRVGDRPDSTMVLMSGIAKVHKTSRNGEEVLLELCGPGDLLGEISAVGGSARSATVTALSDVEACVIGVPDLRAFLAAHPQGTLGMLEVALTRQRAADARRVEFATSGSLGRVASRLVELAERFGDADPNGAIVASLPINQELLASWSASSKESTARALRTLRDLNVIQTSRMRLIVLDLEHLRYHAGQASVEQTRTT